MKGGYTVIVKLLLEYPKSVTQIVTVRENNNKKIHDLQSIENDHSQRLSSNTFNGKKKRTTSSSSTSSSSSTASSSSSSKSKQTSQSFLPNPPQTIDFFSTCPNQSKSSSLSNKSTFPSLHYHQHYSKLKKSFHRTSIKTNRRIEQIDTQIKNLKFLPSSPSINECQSNPTKISMCINTDTQKALEHLRELVNHPSSLELKTNPNLVQKIKKVANQSFSEQLKSLPPFTSSLNKLTNHEQLPIVTCLKKKTIHEDNQSSPPSSLVNNLSQTNSHSTITCSDSSTLSHLRFQNRIDIDCETESNHDTALTLACAGGHEEPVNLLLHRGSNIEHRDKKGFTPLILAGLINQFILISKYLIVGV